MKAILVFDMKADELPNDAFANVYVFGKYYKEQLDDFLAYKESVPLKPMPLKRETHVYWKSVGIGNIPTHEITDYDKGWNDCVDFLEGDMQDD